MTSGDTMSDEFTQTIVLDQVPFPRQPDSPMESGNSTGRKPLDGQTDNGVRGTPAYPAFEDTSWLT